MTYLQTILGEISPIESIKNQGKIKSNKVDKKEKGRVKEERSSEGEITNNVVSTENIGEKHDNTNNHIDISQESSSPTTSFSTSTCLLNDGALIIADNTLWKGMVLSQVREKEREDCTVLYCTVRYCGVLPCILMHNTTLFFMVLLYIVACCAIFYCD